ncbi:alginate O-acetyltransferase [Ectopseudomonas khazarica]|uniref:alginate O-acetyltransferase n=1 Tax=Ectopseudomonas khazarica TaxID=2502979 RepID=UPI001AEF9B19|nr:alginate O-acetyltransferase [Pseudomonas khazarica]QTS87567.1 alginate O-acetyltransferase [Pseudomonas khazarica]
MNRPIKTLYVVLFSLLLLPVSLLALANLADYRMPAKSSVLDGGLAKSIEQHYDEQFPLKQAGINLWAALEYLAFGEGRSGLVIGDGGWLYSDEEFDPVPDAQRQMRDNLALIRGVQRQLEQRDIHLVLAILPAKTRLYPEHTGEHHPSALQTSLYPRFHRAVRNAGIAAPDLLGPLLAGKGKAQMFLRTDTHWTPQGADVTARALSDVVRSAVQLRGEPQRFVTETVETRAHQGDLTRFLPLAPLFESLLPRADQLQQRETHSAQASSDDLFADSDMPVALVGTSYSANPAWNFAGALRQHLQRDLGNYAEEGEGPLVPMLKYLQSEEFADNPPQLVIWEFPERYLPMTSDFTDFDPQWLAALKAGGERQGLAAASH